MGEPGVSEFEEWVVARLDVLSAKLRRQPADGQDIIAQMSELVAVRRALARFREERSW